MENAESSRNIAAHQNWYSMQIACIESTVLYLSSDRLQSFGNLLQSSTEPPVHDMWDVAAMICNNWRRQSVPEMQPPNMIELLFVYPSFNS